MLHAVGEPEGAQRAFERGLDLDPTAAYILGNMCYLAMREGDLDEALGLCEAALAIDPTLAAASTNLALLHVATERDDRAQPNWAEPRHRAKQARAKSTTGPQSR